MPPPLKDVCINGHAMSGDNVRVLRSGARKCVECCKQRARQFYARHTEAERQRLRQYRQQRRPLLSGQPSDADLDAKALADWNPAWGTR